MLIIRYAAMNGFFKAAACIALTDIIFFQSSGFTVMVLEGGPMRYMHEFDFSKTAA